MTRPGADDELTDLFIGADVVLDEPAGPAEDDAEQVGVSPDR